MEFEEKVAKIILKEKLDELYEKVGTALQKYDALSPEAKKDPKIVEGMRNTRTHMIKIAELLCGKEEVERILNHNNEIGDK